MFYLDGAKFTIILALFTVLFGVVIGVVLALLKISENKVLNLIATAYIEFIRGTPLMVQLFIIYFGLPTLTNLHLPDMTAGILALAINSGAYVAEVIRAGIQAVDKGQMEAARSLGLTKGMAMRYIIIPQAIKNILPALGNEFITVIKESSIVSIIGIHELMYNADTVRGNTYKAFSPLLIAALIYFVMTFALSKLMGRFERRLKTSD
jgi:polar amino acid transport system permease protein